jgi:TolB protein
MKKTSLALALVAASFGLALWAQQSDLLIKLTGGERPKIALPDFRGTGDAQAQMGVFNETLNADIAGSGYFDVRPKTSYPLAVPQRPQDFKPPVNEQKQGPWLTDWAGAPVNADYLAFGYSAVQGGQLALFGYLYNVRQPDLQNAQAIGKVYFGPLNGDGAKKVAHEFAADILALAGATSLAGSKIYFRSSRSGTFEIWSMDYDGANQQQLTRQGATAMSPVVSFDGTRIAYNVITAKGPSIMMLSTETGRQLPFYNQRASINSTPGFTASGDVIFSSTAGGGWANLYMSSANGAGMKRITNTRAVETHPRVNPKNPSQLVFTSGRSGPPQVYLMNIDGTDVNRLTPGEGEAVQPAWSPNGQFIAFAWTRGFSPGNYNIFVMDVASKTVVQLTHGAGLNENPAWAPDGRHLVFASTRGGGKQLWSMLADGTGLKQLTTQGRNEQPVWTAARQ